MGRVVLVRRWGCFLQMKRAASGFQTGHLGGQIAVVDMVTVALRAPHPGKGAD